MINPYCDLSERKHYVHGLLIFILLALFMVYEEILSATTRIFQYHIFDAVHFSINTVGFWSSFSLYFYTALQIPISLLYDRISSRVIVPFGILLCSAGVILLAWGFNTPLHLYAKTLISLGAPFAFLGLLVMITRWFPSDRFAFMAGMTQLIGAIGFLLAGIPLEVLLKYYFSWNIVMVVLGALGIALAIMCYMIVWDNPLGRLDKAPKAHYLKSLCAIFSSSQTYWIALFAFCGWGLIILLSAIYGVAFLHVRYGISDVHATRLMRLLWLGFGVMSPVIAAIAQRLKRRVFVMRYCTGFGVLLSLVFLYVSGVPLWLSSILIFALGGASASHMLTFALAKERHNLSIAGSALGVNNLITQLGAIFSLFITGVIMMSFQSRHEGYFSLKAYQLALMIVPILFFIAFIISSFLLKDTYAKQHEVVA